MVDYSKWKNIEVSDDEDDTHPNIDTPSLFKWRHEARIKRMQEFEDEKRRLKLTIVENDQKKAKLKKKIEEHTEPVEELHKQLEKLEAEAKELNSKSEELKKKEKLLPWNVDTISKESWSKTVINKPKPRNISEMTDEERQERYKIFVNSNESKIRSFGMLSKWEDCKRFLLENQNLCCEDTTNYLAIWCLNLEIERKTDLMEHISKQVISMQYILELAKHLNCDPRSCISTFFTRIQKVDKEYQDAFNNELESFRSRIKESAKRKLDEAVKEIEEEERLKRLGPGGLDPIEVFESLPSPLKECFDKKDTEKLKEVLASMNNEEAYYHMQRCVDSGLWVPESKTQEESKESNTANEPQN